MRAARERGLIPTVCSGALRILHPAFYGSVVRHQHRKGTAAASRGRCAGWVGVLLAAALAVADSQIKVLSNAEVRGSLPDFPPAGPVPK